MKCIFRWPIISILAGFLLSASLVRADMGPIIRKGDGAMASTTPHETIRLLSQEVTIRLKKMSYLVNATFHFRNTSGSIEEWVGFSKRTIWSDITRKFGHDIVWFKTWVDGSEIFASDLRDLTYGPDRFRPLVHGNRWMAHNVTFTGHGITKIQLIYEAGYNHREGFRSAHYIYGTGAYWKDTIGTAVFTIDGSEIGGIKHFVVHSDILKRPSRLSRENFETYQVEDLEPLPGDELVVDVKL